MMCLGIEPGAAGWKARMNPLSYGGTPISVFVTCRRQTAYKWDPVTKDCEGFVIPQESYKEYDKTPINKIYVLKKGMNCKSYN